MKRLILALFMLVLSGPALAVFTKPPDVPDYVSPTHTYAAGTTLNRVGDGSATGGTPPAAAYELSEVNAAPLAPWTTASGTQCLTIYEGGTCSEAKVRFLIGGFSHCLADDPIRNYGQPGTSHFHCFFGNPSTNAYSTYASLRNKGANSRASGGPLNSTGYWVPAMLSTIGGKTYARRNTGPIILYYEIAPALADQTTYFPLGLRYVTGYNMDDADAWLQAKIDAANAQPGTSGRYSKCQGGTNCEVLIRWTCNSTVNGLSLSDRIANADGSDAFGGKCEAGADFWIQFSGARCWDGINLWSPGGYKHVYPAIWDNAANDFVCADGHYKLPSLQLQIHYPQNGVSDRANMRLASDPVGGIPGKTFHTDWFNGWQRSVLRSWLEYCIGVQNVSPSRECNASAFSGTQSLLTTPSNNQPAASATDTSKFFKVPTTSNGPKTLHVHGG